MPSSEMLAAPRKKALHTRSGGPGRSSVAITSHSNSKAGATAAVPMTVGRDSSRSIQGARGRGSGLSQPTIGLHWRIQDSAGYFAAGHNRGGFATPPEQDAVRFWLHLLTNDR